MLGSGLNCFPSEFKCSGYVLVVQLLGYLLLHSELLELLHNDFLFLFDLFIPSVWVLKAHVEHLLLSQVLIDVFPSHLKSFQVHADFALALDQSGKLHFFTLQILLLTRGQWLRRLLDHLLPCVSIFLDLAGMVDNHLVDGLADTS